MKSPAYGPSSITTAHFLTKSRPVTLFRHGKGGTAIQSLPKIRYLKENLGGTQNSDARTPRSCLRLKIGHLRRAIGRMPRRMSMQPMLTGAAPTPHRLCGASSGVLAIIFFGTPCV